MKLHSKVERHNYLPQYYQFFIIAKSFQLQMGFSFPFLRVNNLRTPILIMRTRSLSYVGLFLNLIVNSVNNDYQHVKFGKNVSMSQNPHLRQKRMGTGIIIVRRTTITSRPRQGRAARKLHSGWMPTRTRTRTQMRTPTPTLTSRSRWKYGYNSEFFSFWKDW